MSDCLAPSLHVNRKKTMVSTLITEVSEKEALPVEAPPIAMRRRSKALLLLATSSNAYAYMPTAIPADGHPSSRRLSTNRAALTSMCDTRGLVVPTESTGVRLDAGIAVLPHPEKARGEDSFFINDGGYFAVFDGVGGWASMGVDAGAFSRSLAANTADAVAVMLSLEGFGKDTASDLELALETGLSEVTVLGSATACMLYISSDGVATILNLGDSGFHVFRPPSSADDDGETIRPAEEARPMQLVAKSRAMQHSFNFPYQLTSKAADVAAHQLDLPSDGER